MQAVIFSYINTPSKKNLHKHMMPLQESLKSFESLINILCTVSEIWTGDPTNQTGTAASGCSRSQGSMASGSRATSTTYSDMLTTHAWTSHDRKLPLYLQERDDRNFWQLAHMCIKTGRANISFLRTQTKFSKGYQLVTSKERERHINWQRFKSCRSPRNQDDC